MQECKGRLPRLHARCHAGHCHSSKGRRCHDAWRQDIVIWVQTCLCRVLCSSSRAAPGVQTCEPRAQATRRRRRCCSGCCAPAAARTSARSSAGCARACSMTRSPSSWCRRTRRAPARPAAPAAPAARLLSRTRRARAPACPRPWKPLPYGMEVATAWAMLRACSGLHHVPHSADQNRRTRRRLAATAWRRTASRRGGARASGCGARATRLGSRRRTPPARRCTMCPRCWRPPRTPSWPQARCGGLAGFAQRLLRLGACSAATACILDQDAPPWQQACQCREKARTGHAVQHLLV
jgi:hypothetical protein